MNKIPFISSRDKFNLLLIRFHEGKKEIKTCLLDQYYRMAVQHSFFTVKVDLAPKRLVGAIFHKNDKSFKIR